MNPFYDKLQQWATILVWVLSGLSSALMFAGCTNIADKLNCDAANVPEWLLPYLVGAAAAIGFGKTIATIIAGRFGKKMAVIDPSGKPNTVTQKQVDTKSVPDAEPKKA